jgi:hypothetical protein
MGEIYSQIPCRQDLQATKGDDFNMPITFKDNTTHLPIDLTGYTFSAGVIMPEGAIVVDITVTNIDLATGKIKLSLTDIQTTLLLGKYKWFLDWTYGSDTRRIFLGIFEVIEWLI